MADDNKQQPYVLISLYLKLYKEKYNKSITINRYKEKWSMIDIIESVGYDRAKELLEYYFKTGKVGHPLQWFYMNIEKLDTMLNNIQLDKQRRSMLLLQTKQMVEEAKVDE